MSAETSPSLHAGLGRDPVRVRRMFTAIAPRYVLANRLLSLGLDRRWRRVCARRLAPSPDEIALDLACGTGDLALDLSAGGGRVVGIDFTHAMLVQAARRRRADGHQVRRRDLHLACADALALPFAAGSFDAATVAFGVRNFADLDRGLAEMHRVLRPGGRLGILEFSRPRGLLALPALLYLKRVMPMLGRLLSGRDGPYEYLASTISTWPAPEELARRITVAGFTEVTWLPFTSGIAVLHTARVQP